MKKYLSDNTRDGVQVLVNALWQQPTRSSEDGTLILADLPAPSTALPREKSVRKNTNLKLILGTKSQGRDSLGEIRQREGHRQQEEIQIGVG